MTWSPTVVGSASPRRSWRRTCAAAAPAPTPRRRSAPPDPFDLQRFRAAQQQGGTYAAALAELRAGRKRSHWIWFVFPQLDGLGSSPTARRYAIRSLAEARAYLADDALGPRLHECCQTLLALDAGASAEAVLGGIDALKLRSSMTLFALAAPGEPLFTQVLERYYDGQTDAATERLLAATDS